LDKKSPAAKYVLEYKNPQNSVNSAGDIAEVLREKIYSNFCVVKHQRKPSEEEKQLKVREVNEALDKLVFHAGGSAFLFIQLL
jgi:hypothetical protein